MGAQIIFDGDSITVGDYAWYNPAWRTIEKLCLLGHQIDRIRNFAVSGQTAQDMESDASSQIDTLFSGSYSANVLVMWGGTNDLYFGASAATTISRISTYCANRQSAGWTVIVCTILPRSNSGTPGSFETDRQTVNTSIRANWATYADVLADVAANTLIGDDNDELNNDYYYDLVHLNRNGWEVVSDIWAPLIAALL